MRKTIGALLALALALGSGVAWARGGQHIGGPLPSLRAQIWANAKAQKALSGLTRPSLRLEKQKGTNKVTASIYSMGWGGAGGPVHRLRQEFATFKVLQAVEGKIAIPVKQHGAIWHRIFYAGPALPQ